MSAQVDVILVRPKEDGNVGAIARLAKNFGVRGLVLVAPRARLGIEAYRRAMAGQPFLKNARIVKNFADAVSEADLIVGTTDLSTGRARTYLRRGVAPERLGEMLRPMVGRVAIVFGPEDDGLGREELGECDLLVHIPARREFPTLNLSHAVSVVLYAVHRGRGIDHPESTPEPEELTLHGGEKELFLERIDELARRVGYPAHKRRGLMLLFRRVMGRSTPTESEYRMLLGFLKSIDRRLKRTHG
ncbi:MAG: RNA methyltransferase [Thermoplasmata archaeon]|nr:RNA methyltransferase [Thermoplasmata archaeon]